MGRRITTQGHFIKRLIRRFRSLVFCSLAIVTMVACLCISPNSFAKVAMQADSNQLEPVQLEKKGQPIPSIVQARDLVEEGKSLYETSQYEQAATVLEQAAQQYRSQNDSLRLAATLANLSLTYQQIGDWEKATQAITEAISSLKAQAVTPKVLQLQAQAFDVQGRLLLTKGNGEAALTQWQQAERFYQQANDEKGVIKARLNQAQALRSLGFSRRALEQLSRVNQTLQTQADSREKAIALRALGDALQVSGDLSESEKALTQSLEIAQRLQLSSEIGAIWLSLGNTARALKAYDDAISAYQQAASLSTSSLTRVQAQLNQLSVLIDQRDWIGIQLVLPQLAPDLEKLPTSRMGVYAQINFAQALLKLGKGEMMTNPQTGRSRQPSANSTPKISAPSPFALIPYPQTLSQLLQTTLERSIRQARELSDKRAESYSLGALGEVYEQTGQVKEARQVTQQALVLAQSSNTWDIAYRWQWQLGRLLRKDGDVNAAIAAYDAAISNLKSLRGDLAATNPDVQFNFREGIEPIYRESVELLLQSQSENPDTATLNKARTQLEDLQLAELDNFFREACLQGQRVLIDEVVKDHPTTAILYPIVLRDRKNQTATLQIIAKIPGQDLKLYTTPLNQSEFDTTLESLRQNLPEAKTRKELAELRANARKVYGWLVEPVERDIQALNKTKQQAVSNPGSTNSPSQDVNTLVFILDDSLRSIPMSVLWDGEHYLIEKYSIALSLGLQLFDPKPIAREPLQVLAAGLSDPPEGEPLPYVQSEITAISKAGLPVTQLLNQDFTSQTLENKINAAPFNVVHLATHGKFSSRVEETFILANDRKINVIEFDSLLRSRDVARPDAIQLLVLSACETATNDNRATLGLAGFAVRAGARSTLASLFKVSDASTAWLIARFYKELNNPKEEISKAEALRRAQVALINREGYSNPLYWAPYVLIGNWL